MSTYLPSPDPVLLSGARLVSSRRADLGLTTYDLASLCHMAVEALEMFERGRYVPQPSQADALASILQIDRDQFREWALTQLLLHPQLLASAVRAMD